MYNGRIVRSAVGILLLSSLLQSQPSPSFRVETHLIKVPVTVFDEQGRILTHLDRDHFTLFDEGKPRAIENFVLDKEPVWAVLLLDVSGSIREELDEMRASALEFSRAFGNEDRIAVFSFSDKTELLQSWTNDRRRLQRSLRGLQRGYRTALYDALLVSGQDYLGRAPGKKVMVVLTDGLDNESRSTYEEVLEKFLALDISLYIVSRTRIIQPKVEGSTRVEFLNQVMRNVLGEPEDFVDIYFREKETALNHLAGVTGGRVFFPDKLDQLTDKYVQLARELKSQYVLTFRPAESSDLEFRNISVRCTQPVGQILHRSQYFWRPVYGRPAASTAPAGSEF